jgi:hypothetical protein
MDHEHEVATVICQQWEESERGWGVRPDGYSLHLSAQDAKKYIDYHWEAMPKYVPNEYSRPCGKPYECEVDYDTYQELKKLGYIRKYKNTYPKPICSNHDLCWRPIDERP